MQRRLIARLLPPLLTIAALFAAFGFARADAIGTRAPGDCDGDGTVTAADAAILLRSVMRQGAADTDAADVTKNGVIDRTDVRAALFMASGQISDPVKFVERISTGLCGEALFDRFYYAGVYDDRQGNYRSANVSVTVEERDYAGSVCFIADIYVQDVQCFATAFSSGRYRGGIERVTAMAQKNDAILAVNGDFYVQRDMGPVVRNGVTYNKRVSNYWDICVLTRGGALLTFPYRTLTAETFSGLDAYQSWVFGPSLLDEAGRAKTKFRSAVTATNPRTVIGYYAPGHYCFLTVDGRQSRYSSGLTMEQLSALCAELGLAAAYNLDGGRSSVMATRYGTVNRPVSGGRGVSDIVYVREPEE